MGCICSKAKSPDQYVSQNRSEDLKAISSPNTNHFGDTTSLISNANQHSNSNSNATEEKASTPIFSDQLQHKGDKNANGNGVRPSKHTQQPKMGRLYSITRGEKGVQVLAGWPSWLSAVAGEAISGWIPRRADSFEKLDKAIPIIIYCFLFPFLMSPIISFSSNYLPNKLSCHLADWPRNLQQCL